MTKITTTANNPPTTSASPSHLQEQLRQRNKTLFETIVDRWGIDEDYFGNHLSVLEQYERDVLAMGMPIRGNDGDDDHRHMARPADGKDDDDEKDVEVDDTLGTNNRSTEVDGATNASFSIDDDHRAKPMKTERGGETRSSSKNDNDDENDNYSPRINIDTNTFKEREEGVEEKTLLEIRAQSFKFLDSKWKSFQPGVLRLSNVIIHTNQSTDTNENDNDDAATVVTATSHQHRMVLRNSIGKVLLNLSVSKGMTFELVPMEKVGAKSGGYVRFMAVEKKEMGLETFMLKVTEDEVQSLYSTLMEMVE